VRVELVAVIEDAATVPVARDFAVLLQAANGEGQVRSSLRPCQPWRRLALEPFHDHRGRSLDDGLEHVVRETQRELGERVGHGLCAVVR
jgi:hypothetical protein